MKRKVVIVRETVNRISETHMFLPPNAVSLFPRVRPLPSGASPSKAGQVVRRASNGRPRTQRDNAYTIQTSHLHYLGNGVWISAGLRKVDDASDGGNARSAS